MAITAESPLAIAGLQMFWLLPRLPDRLQSQLDANQPREPAESAGGYLGTLVARLVSPYKALGHTPPSRPEELLCEVWD